MKIIIHNVIRFEFDTNWSCECVLKNTCYEFYVVNEEMYTKYYVESAAFDYLPTLIDIEKYITENFEWWSSLYLEAMA